MRRMELATTEKKTNTNISSNEDFSEEEKIGKWQDNISYTALEKLQAHYEHTDTIIRTNEPFSSELYAGGAKEKSLECTIKRMFEIAEEAEVKPLGTEFTFTKISQNVATTFLNRDPLKQIHKEGTVTSLFNHGVMCDQFLHVFPKETLLINGLETANHSQFIFKTNTLAKDRFEPERVKHVFINLKKDKGT